MDSFQDDNDFRPTISPYGSTQVQLYFKRKGPLYVPSELLEKSPALAIRHSRGNPVFLDDVPLNAGHVLVHFLYTGRYECLKPEGQSPQAKQTTEFETSLRVFSLARVFHLPFLRIMATRQIRRLGNSLSLPCILDVLDDVHRNFCNEDEWLEKYVASRTRSELNALDRPRADALLLEIGCATTLNKVLLKALVNKELEEEPEPPEEETPIPEEKPTVEDRPVEFENPVEEENPTEEAWPAEDPAEDKQVEDKPVEEEWPTEESAYYRAAEDNAHPSEKVPPIVGYPNSGRGNDYCPYRANFWDYVQVPDFSNVQYYQSKSPSPDQDLSATAEYVDARQHDPFMRVSLTAPEPSPTKKFKKDKKKNKKKAAAKEEEATDEI